MEFVSQAGSGVSANQGLVEEQEGRSPDYVFAAYATRLASGAHPSSLARARPCCRPTTASLRATHRLPCHQARRRRGKRDRYAHPTTPWNVLASWAPKRPLTGHAIHSPFITGPSLPAAQATFLHSQRVACTACMSCAVPIRLTDTRIESRQHAGGAEGSKYKRVSGDHRKARNRARAGSWQYEISRCIPSASTRRRVRCAFQPDSLQRGFPGFGVESERRRLPRTQPLCVVARGIYTRS